MATGQEAATSPDTLQSAAAQATGRLIADKSWKSWARRPDGPEGFQWSDLVPGIGAQWSYARRRRLGDARAKDKECPVCCEDDPEPDAKGRRWQRLYCGCTVCSQCVQRWNSAQLDDDAAAPSQQGAGALPRLTCPACKAALRAADAVQVLKGCPEVAARCEEFSRDNTLRTTPEWRSCPKCKGGGFTTPECLAEQRLELCRKAASEANVYLVYLTVLIFVWIAFHNILRPDGQDPDIRRPVSHVLASAGAAAAAIWLLNQAQSGVSAILATPISVACPNCDCDFVLPGYVEALADANAEEETQKWIASNTRPCPSCGSPIQKTSGCNHMRCLNCRAHFCWACMRLGRECGAFGCHNGAPFGNARSSDLTEHPEPTRQMGNRREPWSDDPAHVLRAIRISVRAAVLLMGLATAGAVCEWIEMHGAAAGDGQGGIGDLLAVLAVWVGVGRMVPGALLRLLIIAALVGVALVMLFYMFGFLLLLGIAHHISSNWRNRRNR